MQFWLFCFFICALVFDVQAKPIKPTTAKRLEYLSQAEVWSPTEIETLDIVAGPQTHFPFAHNELIECAFSEPGKTAYNGVSLKFECKLGDEKLKVKFLKDKKANREVFSEVASTRLFWALGFFADTAVPVQVKCLNCPEDPYKGNGLIEDRIYNHASLEEKRAGEEIEEFKNQGWTFQELEMTAGTYGEKLTDRQIQVEALKLLAIFVQHGDRKAEQQRLTCAEDQIKKLDGEKICLAPQMLIQDLGATFGGAGIRSHPVISKMNLEHWAAESIFDEKLYKKTFNESLGSGICEGNIRVSYKAKDSLGVENPIIRDEGRQFLFGLLKRFRDSGKVPELFRAANTDALAEEHSVKVAETRETIKGVAAWTYVFHLKMNEIENHKCCVPDAEKKRCAL